MPETFETIVSRLERTAAELRSGDLEPRQAAALVDDLARLAAEAGGELDRRVRSGDQPLGPPGHLAFNSRPPRPPRPRIPTISAARSRPTCATCASPPASPPPRAWTRPC